MKSIAFGLAVAISISAQVVIPGTQADKLHQVQYAKLPLRFEPNVGRTDPAVKYLSRGNGYTLFLTSTEAVLGLATKGADGKPSGRTSVVKMQFAGGNPKTQIEPGDALPSRSNFFVGNDPSKWRANVPNYARMQYRNVYPGVDAVFYGNQRQLEYDLVLAPGADPRRIQLKFDGVERIGAADNGDLVLRTSAGSIRQRKPVVYQMVGAERREIESRYVIHGNQVGFEVAQYDAGQQLVIDPVLLYSVFEGGTNLDQATGIAVDGSGNAYIAGFTLSADFPHLNSVQSGKAVALDAFVAKINSSGSLVYSTYLGGNASDNASSIAVDTSGNAYVTGVTNSTDFPTVNPLQSSLTGGQNAFVSKISSAGNALIYSTYLGGTNNDQGAGIAVDSSGNAYIAGFTNSDDFPRVTAQQPAIYPAKGGTPGDGNFDAWVAKIDSTGSHLIYATYLGGSTNDQAAGIAVDTSNPPNVYVTGYTTSSDFPHINAIFGTYGGGTSDGFVTKINGAGTAVVYSTFLGGSAADQGRAIAVDASNPANVYVTGDTTSIDFPHNNGLFPTLDGTAKHDAFVTKINGLGTALVYSTYLGGTGADFGLGIAADAAGNAYLTGNTLSTDFPLHSALQGTFGGGTCLNGTQPAQDAFVSKIDATGSTLAFSTYLGGSGCDAAGGIAVDINGNVYVAGGTTSTDFPHTSGSNAGGGGDAFVWVISQTLSITKTHSGNFTQGQQNATYTVTVANGGSGPTSGTATVTETVPAGLTLVSMSGTGWMCASTTCSRSDALAAGSSYPPITVTVNVAANATSPQVNQVTLSGAGTGSASDSTIVINPSASLLSISKTHAGSFKQGQQNATYTLTVSNASGVAATSGTVTVTETAPSGLTLVSMSGAGWTCGSTTCTRADALAAGSSYPAITVTVNVATNATSPQVNQANVSGGGSAGANASDSTVILSASVLSIAKNHTGNFAQGQQNATYTVTVSNATGVGATNGTVTVTESAPSGLTLVSMSGSGWTCGSTTCSRNDALAAGSSYPPITVTVNVAANATSPQLNQVSVSGGGSATMNASDSTVITGFTGSLDIADCNTIAGWAADRNRLNQSINVDIYDGNTLIATVAANVNRPDVGSFLGDNGNHGFSVATPASLKDGNPHSLSVKFGGSATNLSGSPRSLSCSLPALYTGSLDIANCSTIAGWAADRNRLNQSINVDIYDGNTLIATVLANVNRPDVGSFLGDNGNHGFSIATPASLKDGNPHSLSVKFGGSATNLSGSPKSLSCSAALYTGSLDIANCSTIAGWAADRNRLNQSISVDIYDGATLIASVAANVSRPDVGSYLGDNGNHGFSLSTPASLRDGNPHSLSVKFGGSATNVSGSPTSLSCPVPQYTGSVDITNCTQIAGWAADRSLLNQSINVDLYDGATLIATVLASQNRPDVGSFLGDNGNHGFNIATPSSLKTGTAHSVGVKFGGTATSLPNSPKSLTCP